MQNVVVVALNLFPKDSNYKQYENLSARDKIEHIANRIKILISDLEHREPESKWIFVFREYGISNCDKHFISNEDKKILKRVFENLTAQYKHKLIIISGALAVTKFHDEKILLDKLPKIDGYYQHSLKEYNSKATRQHYEQFKAIQNKSTDAFLVRNTVYMFADGKCFARHDKAAPFDETLTRKPDFKGPPHLRPPIVYQPGNKINSTCIYMLPVNDEYVSLGLETCMEHAIGRLANESNDKNINIMLQLILSAHTFVNLNNFVGEYFILVDSKIRPQILLKNKLIEDELYNLPIRLYENDLLDKQDFVVRGPLRPIFPEKEIIFFDKFYNLTQSLINSNISNRSDRVKKLFSIMAKCRREVGEGFKTHKIYRGITDLPQYDTLIANDSQDEEVEKFILELKKVLSALVRLEIDIAPSSSQEVKVLIHKKFSMFNSANQEKHKNENMVGPSCNI